MFLYRLLLGRILQYRVYNLPQLTFYFYKLFLQSIHLVQRLILLTILYGCIVPKFPIGSLASSLLTFLIFSADGIIQVVQGRRSIQIHYGLSYTSFLKAWSLHIALAQQIVLIYSRIRFSIIILISFIKEGIRGIVLD